MGHHQALTALEGLIWISTLIRGSFQFCPRMIRLVGRDQAPALARGDNPELAIHTFPERPQYPVGLLVSRVERLVRGMG